MTVTRIDDLPRIGSSWNFVGRDHEGVPFSFYLVEALPGKGAPLHRHDYDEVVLVQAGRARFVINETTSDAEPGNILVIKAGTPHGFVNIGRETLVQIDIHANSAFQQTNLPPTAVSSQAGLPE
jgi:mannose-6-phosphate isomerase-like protein (cupin superfamily)